MFEYTSNNYGYKYREVFPVRVFLGSVFIYMAPVGLAGSQTDLYHCWLAAGCPH